MTSFRSACGTWRFLDGELYRRVTEAGKPLWVHVSSSPTYLEEVLMRLLTEVLEEILSDVERK